MSAAEQIRATIDALEIPDDEIVELQCLDCSDGTRAAFVRAADVSSMRIPECTGAYIIANPILPQATTRRQVGTWTTLRGRGAGTSDADIAGRRVLPIDVDPVRPTGTSATHVQKAEAVAVADRVYAFLTETACVPENAITRLDSGNGAHLWIALGSLDNDATTRAQVRAVLDGLAARFDIADHVKIDTSVHDAKRLLPLAGTLKRKGRPSDDAPHRPVTIVPPAMPVRLSAVELAALASKIAPTKATEKPGPAKAKGTSVYDRANATDLHDLAARLGIARDGDTVECPGCGRHSGSMAAIMTGTGGEMWIKCASGTCAPHRQGRWSAVDTLAAVRQISPLAAARELAGEAPATATASNDNDPALVLVGLTSKIDALGSTGERLTTGFPTFDAACRGGLPMQRVIVVGGAPGAAKTTTVAQWALRWAEQGVPVAFLAADEEAGGILVRWGQAVGIALDDLEVGTAATKARLADALGALPLDLVDSEDSDDAITIERVSAELAAKRGLGSASVLIIDSIQMAKATGTEGIDSPRERIDAVVKALKRAAKRDGHLVIVTSELARAAYRGDNEINPLAAFKESGSIEYGVGTALVLRTVDGEPTLIDVSIPKNRIGRSADAKRPFRLRLDFARATLTEADLPAKDRTDPAGRAEALENSIYRVTEAQALYSKDAVYAALKDEGSAPRKATVTSLLSAMLDDGRLSWAGKGSRLARPLVLQRS